MLAIITLIETMKLHPPVVFREQLPYLVALPTRRPPEHGEQPEPVCPPCPLDLAAVNRQPDAQEDGDKDAFQGDDDEVDHPITTASICPFVCVAPAAPYSTNW